jgi:hypothetical protein
MCSEYGLGWGRSHPSEGANTGSRIKIRAQEVPENDLRVNGPRHPNEKGHRLDDPSAGNDENVTWHARGTVSGWVTGSSGKGHE